MTISKTTNACHSYGTTLLRGGRLIKWKGQVASLSPSLGQLVASVSPVALGRALMVGANRAATAVAIKNFIFFNFIVSSETCSYEV